MSLAADPAPGARALRERRRFTLPALLLGAEFAFLSLLVDFPVSGPALGLVNVARTLVPVVIGTAAAGLLIARHRPGGVMAELRALPEPRPWPMLVAHLAAFAASAALAWRLMGPERPAMSPGVFAAWLGCVGVTVLLAIGVAASPAAVLRIAARRLSAPLLATGVGLLTWRAIAAAEQLWGVLQVGTLGATAALLAALGATVHVDPPASVLGVGAFEVAIAPICSGADGVGLVILFLAVWLSLARTRVRVGRALLLLLPAGIAAALVANVVRISILILVGASGRTELAMGAFHSKLGWLLFTAIAFAAVALAERVPWLRRDTPAAAAEELPAAAAAYVAPLLAALATAFLTSLSAREGLDPLYGARVVAAGLALVAVRRSLPRPALAPSWPPLALAAIVTVLWIAWGGQVGSRLGQAVCDLAPGYRAAWILLRLLGACVVLPVAEELAFRGFLLPWLVSADFERLPPRTWSWPAILLSSVAFGAVHEQWVLGTVAGVAFAIARVWRGRLGDAVVAHAACNTALSLMVLVRGRWDLWG